MYETEWERPIDPEDEDICPECGGDANQEGCAPGCPEYGDEEMGYDADQAADERAMAAEMLNR